jgi:hypothetical protein
MAGHLIHVGFPKTGSTSLQEWFSTHPELVYAGGHLGGYPYVWSVEGAQTTHRWHVTSYEGWAAPPPSDVRDLRTLRGVGAKRAHIAETLQMLFGEPTILLVTRGFQSILAAFYATHIGRGGCSTVTGMLADMGEDLAVALDYNAVVDLYSSAFGAANLLVLPFELLRDDPRQFLGVLQHRLGLTSDEPFPWRNRSLSPSELYWYRGMAHLVDRASRPLGRRQRDGVREFYRRRIGGPDLTRTINLLSRMAPGRVTHPSREIPSEIVDRLRGRASCLATLPLYASYHTEYLNDPA